MMRALHVQAQARGAPAHASHQASRQRPSLAPSRRQLLSAVPAAGLLALVAGRSQAVGLESIDLPSVGLPGPAAQALEELRSSNQVCRGLGLRVPSALPSYLVAQVKEQPHPLPQPAHRSVPPPTPRFILLYPLQATLDAAEEAFQNSELLRSLKERTEANKDKCAGFGGSGDARERHWPDACTLPRWPAGLCKCKSRPAG